MTFAVILRLQEVAFYVSIEAFFLFTPQCCLYRFAPHDSEGVYTKIDFDIAHLYRYSEAQRAPNSRSHELDRLAKPLKFSSR